MNSYHMPGDAEAQAAIAGMQETYGEPPKTFRANEWVTFYQEGRPVRALVVEDETEAGLVRVTYHAATGKKYAEFSSTELSYF